MPVALGSRLGTRNPAMASIFDPPGQEYEKHLPTFRPVQCMYAKTLDATPLPYFASQ